MYNKTVARLIFLTSLLINMNVECFYASVIFLILFLFALCWPSCHKKIFFITTFIWNNEYPELFAASLRVSDFSLLVCDGLKSGFSELLGIENFGDWMLELLTVTADGFFSVWRVVCGSKGDMNRPRWLMPSQNA